MIQQSPRVSSDVQVCSRRPSASSAVLPRLKLHSLPFEGLQSKREATAENQPNIVHLDFSFLRSFEVVANQYTESGITFHNTIALRPSNPAFLVEAEKTVLMGAPKSGVLDATFTRPVKFVSVTLTGSQRTVMTGFKSDGAIATKAEMTTGNLIDSDSPYQPNYLLDTRDVDGIHRIRIRSIGGQFTISSIMFAS